MTTLEERRGSDVTLDVIQAHLYRRHGRPEVGGIVARSERNSATETHFTTDDVRVGHCPAVIAN